MPRCTRSHLFTLLVLTAVLLVCAPPASAQDAPSSEGPLPDDSVTEALAESIDPSDLGDALDPADLQSLDPEQAEQLAAALAAAEGSAPTPVSLPSGQAQSAVTPQAISLPNAEGSVEGMGESFAPVLSSGTATFKVPIALPPGRSGVQPSLGLSYASTGGNSSVGIGWSLGAPMISRQTDRGLPRYDDRAAWHPEEDRFIYNGGQELVPVDSAAMQTIDCADQDDTTSCAPIPTELRDWQQYRARVEGGFLRFFRSPDSRRWVVQGKDGTRFDFGVLMAGDGPSEMQSASVDALVSEEDGGAGRVFEWLLTRMSDAHGSTVYYQYLADGGQRYLTDLTYVSPARCASASAGTAGATLSQRRCNAPLSDYGRHVQLVYESRPDAFTSFIMGWGVTTALRLKRIEVSAAQGAPGLRTLVRRYHLRYDASSYHSLLSELQVEGRPSSERPDVGVFVGDPGVEEGSLGDSIRGELLPPMRFQYSTQPTSGPQVAGFGGLDGSVRDVLGSPDHSVDEARSDLFDVNSDGLPDLIVTDPARFRTAEGEPGVGVYFNGFSGADAMPSHATDSMGRVRGGVFSDAVVMGVPRGFDGVMTLSNLNIRPMDIDGDGRSELLYMPRIREYGYFVPTRAPDVGASEVSPARQGWRFSRVVPQLPPGFTDPRIDFTRDGARIKVFDVNNDHLVDVVRTAGTRVETWLNLGWLPEGNGRFGSARYSEGRGEWVLSADPLETCVISAGLPLDFADPEVRLADMNGDGVQDIVKIRRGRVQYWPGKGDGAWGVEAQDCVAPGFAPANYVDMASAPPELNPDLAGVFLTDVNSDGATDVVQVRFRDVDVWFNRGGTGFTERITLRSTPAAPDFAPRTRLADIDGSGTLDLVYANAGRWQFLDFMGGTRPRLLVGVENGLGATTTMTYDSAAADYLADLEEAADCTEGAPTCERFTWSDIAATGCDARYAERDELTSPTTARCYRPNGSSVTSTVVRAVSTSDHFDLLGREPQVSESRFAYHDGYYEGIEQEFRGFGAADAETVGDFNHPTSTTRTHFLQGRRPADIASDRLADNPNEALKGRQVSSETFDASGVVLSSDHASFVVRRLMLGLTGVSISYAYVSQSDSLRYDNAPFEPLNAPLTLPAVAREDLATAGAPPLPPDTMETTYIAGARYAHIRSVTPSVDNVGNVLVQTALGRVRGEFGARDAPLPDESITTHTTPVNLPDASSGWLWRTAHTFVDGHGSGVPLGDTTTDYNALGDLLRSVVHVSQRQARAAGDPFAGVARLPNFAGDGSAAGLPSHEEDVVSSSAYDSWGNALTTCGGDLNDASVPCLRRSDVTYDGDYQQFPEVESVDVSPSAVGTLSYRAVWDRGLSVITEATDPNGFVTRATYDGLSRPTSSTPPDGAGCDGASRPLTRIHYHLAGQHSEAEPFAPELRPLSRVVTTTELSCAASSLGADATTLTSIRYADGLGRVRAQLDTGDEDASHLWVKTGIVTLDKKGTTRRSYQPSFFGASADDYAGAVALPSVPSVTARYDAFGRARASVNEDGSSTWTSYHALSTDVCDPNDLDASSPHYRTCTTTRTDGHGRTIDLIQRNRQADRPGVETYRLFTDYRADNAVVRVRRLQTSNDAPRASSLVVSGHVVERELFYDSVARRIAATDPDTDARDEPDPERSTWRYLFNRVGDLAGVRDPRGCGQNFYYDHAGRLIGEAYVSCAEAEAQEAPSADSAVPAGAIGFGVLASATSVDRRLYFDSYPAWTLPSGGLPASPDFVEFPGVDARGALGRATAMTDRGQRCAYAYDERGNLLWEGREMAVLPEAMPDADALPDAGMGPFDPQPPPGTGLASVTYDEAHIYERSLAYDHANRPTAVVLPRDPDFDSGAMGGIGPRIGGTLLYIRRGLPGRMDVRIADGGAGAPIHTPDALTNGGLELPGATLTAYPVVQHLDYLRDALVGRVVYGDGRSSDTFGPPLPGPDTRPDRMATESTTAYDIRRRPFRMRTQREPTSPPGATGRRPLAEVSQVIDQRLTWDVANNLIALTDDRDANEWPLGHRPQSVHIAHDALYRVVGAEYDYTDDAGRRAPEDEATDWRDEYGRTRPNDPMRTDPAEMLPDAPPGRVASQTWEYDWLSNMVDATDDAGAFYERSAGDLENGADFAGGLGASPTLRPSALYVSTGLDSASVASGQGGWLELDYGISGNVTTMTVHAECAQRAAAPACAPVLGGDPNATRQALRDACVCGNEQHYRYAWDELNRLVRARRYEREAGAGSWSLGARLRYRYDGGNQRTVKEVQTIFDAMAPPQERIALYVFPGDFERRGLKRGAGFAAGTYVTPGGALSESQYLVAGARVVWKPGDPALGLDRDHRITFNVSDLLGTTSAVIDLVTGELTECSTYYPGGARETYLTMLDAELQPEPMGFTGKEADEEVGLVYFGERYLIPRIARWTSPDPLAIHALGGGEAMNSYHYVAGNLLQARDPKGLDVTIAEHTTSTTTVRVVHIGVLVVPGDRQSSNAPGTRVSGSELEKEARSLAAAMRSTFRDYQAHEGARTYQYRFVIDVQVLDRRDPVTNRNNTDTSPTGVSRRATTAIAEAAGRGLENVYVVNRSRNGEPTAAARAVPGDPPVTSYLAHDGLLDDASNVVFAGVGEAPRTKSHEVGHLLALSHVASSGNVTDSEEQRRLADGTPQGVATSTDARPLSTIDQARFHRAVQTSAGGIAMPERLRTQGTEPPATLEAASEARKSST